MPLMAASSERPFIKRFMTSRKHYVFDVNSNRILSVLPEVYDVLGDYHCLTYEEILQKHSPNFGRKKVSRAFQDIKEAISREKLFLSVRPQKLSNAGLSPEEFQEAYNHHLRQLVLDITEHCNLRCHYCSREWNQGRKDYRRRHMSEKTALKAIDFLYVHSGQSEKRSLSFYGGEPLLEFELIKQCVDYAHIKFSGDCPRFNVTTNGVLLNKKMAEYFAQYRFGVIISIDGPQSVHDRHRVDSRDEGSYEKGILGLRRLFEAYDERDVDLISINMVITPPYDLDVLHELWEEQTWLPKDISIQPNYVNMEFTDFLDKYNSDPSQTVYRRSRKKFFSTFRRECIEGTPGKTPLAFSFIESAMFNFYNRRVYKPPRTFYPLNGSCVPGNRRVFVSGNGKLWLCEKADGCPSLGSVFSGYDSQRMQNLVDTYAQESLEDCSRCWAAGICSVCFADAFLDEKFDLKRKRSRCRNEREKLTSNLKTYCSILEQNPHAFDYMKTITVS